MFGNGRLPVSNPMIVFREEFDDWAILFDPESGKCLGINPVASSIWKGLDGKHDFEDLLKEIRESFTDVPEDAQSHAEEFIKDLVKIGFAGFEA